MGRERSCNYVLHVHTPVFEAINMYENAPSWLEEQVYTVLLLATN